MCSIVRKQFIAAIVLCVASAAIHAHAAPRFLRDPLLGLQYAPSKARFEPVPPCVLSRCRGLAGDEYMRGVWFVFARADDATGRIFYLINGYEIRSRPEPPDFPRYETGGYGLIVMVRQDQCEVIDADARQSFDDRLFTEELPQDILQRLATDFAVRLKKAFGGKEKLRIEIVNQHIDLDALPEELRASLRDLRCK